MKTRFTAFLLLLVISCTKENIKSPSIAATQSLDSKVTPAATFHIGQSFGGGIIFYIDGTGQHGLIAAKSDQSESATWYNGNYIITGANGKNIGNGAGNTTKIVNAQGKPGNYAALICSKLKSGGFTDWYLPSKNELNKLFKQRAVVGGFQATNYWSSTEADVNNAWDQEFGGGFQFADDKSFTIHVRAVRSF